MIQKVKTDEKLQQMLNEFKIRQPEMSCEGEQKISRMCINPECQKTSLLCNDLQCIHCGKQPHRVCPFNSLDAVTYLLTQRSQIQKNFIYQVNQIENLFIEAIHKSKIQLTKKYYLGDLESKHLKIIEEIYKNNNAKCLKGKEAKQFIDCLKKNRQCFQENGKILLQNYRKTVQQYIDQMIDVKNLLYQSFFKKVELAPKIDFTFKSVILQKPLIVNLESMKPYNSFIIKHSRSLIGQLANQQTQFLKKSLNNPKELQLLYRASQHDFSASTFHQKCDSVANTLTIVRTQFGKTIAGFTPYCWNAVANAYVNQNGKKSFLLSIDLKQKMIPKDGNYLIYCNSTYGPTFGNGHDLVIHDQCNSNRSSYANFPHQYNFEGEPKYTKNQQSYKAFCGAINGSNFVVLQYQVFRVIW